MTPRTKVQLLSVPTTTALPSTGTGLGPGASPLAKERIASDAIKPKIHLSRSQRHDELAERLLGAAEIGAEGLFRLIEEGSIKGRDLAVTIGILIDKVSMLEKRQEPPATNVADLLQNMKRMTAIQAELESRGLPLQG